MLLRQLPTYQRKLQARANLEHNGHLLLLPGGEDDGYLYVFPYRRHYHSFNYLHIVFCFFVYCVNINLTASSVVCMMMPSFACVETRSVSKMN
jgi:hypothetical protein